MNEFCAREIMPRASKSYFKEVADDIGVVAAYQVGHRWWKAWLPSPQTRKDYTNSEHEPRPFQPRQAPIQR